MTGLVWRVGAPALFIFLWASGFIVARTLVGQASALSFLTIRFTITAIGFAALAAAAGAAWPRTPRAWRDAAISGVLMQAIYLGGVFWAVERGLPAGVAALITGLQPLMTAALSGTLLRERVSRRRWTGILIGAAGALLVLRPALASHGTIPPVALLVCFASPVSMTFGTIWQKRTGGVGDLRSNAAIHFAVAALVTAPLALLEGWHFAPTVTVLAGLAWAVLALSLGAVSLLLVLIRRGAVAGVVALLYLVPPVAALLAYAAFGEKLSPLQGFGMLLAMLGVALTQRAEPRTPRPDRGE